MQAIDIKQLFIKDGQCRKSFSQLGRQKSNCEWFAKKMSFPQIRGILSPGLVL